MVSAGGSFHVFAPRWEKHFCLLLDFFIGNLKSVSELRRTYEEHLEFRVKRSHKYWGASPCRDLKTIVLDQDIHITKGPELLCYATGRIRFKFDRFIFKIIVRPTCRHKGT